MAGDKRTWDLDDFGAGIDLRDGLWSRNQARWRDLRNCRTTKGRKPRRRPPVGRYDVQLDAACQGLLAIDGALYTVAKKGDTIAHTGTDAGLVTTLAFDNPDHCTDWELGEFQVFDGYAVAWIIHTFPDAAYPQVAHLHVWDGLIYAPTYVQDPYLPGSFSPSIADLADQRYSADFRPVLGLGASKCWTSTLRGNTHASRTADARVWNQRTLDGLKQDGDQYCFIVPGGAGELRRFIVPRNANDLAADQRWAYYVLERAVGDAWEPMEEVAIEPAVISTWRPSAIASRFADGWDEIAVDVRWGSDAAGLIRLRLVAGATSVEIESEPTVTCTEDGVGSGLWDMALTEASYRHRGGDLQTVPAATYPVHLAEGRTYLLAITADETNHPALIDITNGGFPSGWGREFRCIFKRIVVPVGGADPEVTDYLYAFEADADSAWYTNLIAEYVDLAGAEDAVSLATAAIDNTGGTVSSISSVKNRMLVTYPGSMQLWSIDQDTNRTTFLDQLSFGTDDQARPSPTLFYGAPMVPTAAGFRAISVVGANTDNLQDANLGEPVADLPDLTVRGAVFWPYFGCYVAAGLRDGVVELQTLDYSRESKITAWARWENADWADAGLTDIDASTLLVLGERLVWRSGQRIHHLNAAATLFRDWCDAAGDAYESFGRLHYNDMGAPGRIKHFCSFDIVQDGSCVLAFELPPYGAWLQTMGPQLQGPTVVGTTYGRQRLPMAARGTAIAPTFTSTDEAGWELQHIAITFRMLK